MNREKKAMLLKNGIALWDVISDCGIEGSSDSSIKNASVNDLSPILSAADIKIIAVNGKTAEKYYNRLIYPVTGIKCVYLPSTSPANAAKSVSELVDIWGQVLFMDKHTVHK